MITCIDKPESRTVELVIEGGVTKDDYLETAEHLHDRIQDWGAVNLLEDIRSIDGVEAGAFWDNVKFGFRHFQDIDKVAVVTDKQWIRAATTITDPLIHLDVQTFPREEIETARAWVAAHLDA